MRLPLGSIDETSSLKRTFAILAVVSLLTCGGLVMLWGWSYSDSPVKIDATTGVASAPPKRAIPLPLPSDIDEYLVLIDGRIERWEYAPWSRQWYRYSQGLRLSVLALWFFILSGAFILLWCKRGAENRAALTALGAENRDSSGFPEN